MFEIRSVQRWGFLRALRWRIITRSHPLQTAIYCALLFFIGAAIACWRYLCKSIPVWSMAFGTSVLHFSQDHPHLARILHVFLDAVPDAVPLFLGLAGLVYLMPDLARKIEESKQLRAGVAIICIFFMLLAIAVNAINREEQQNKSNNQDDRLYAVEISNGQILKAVLNPSLDESEIEKHRHIEELLRNKYILTHKDISPGILAGTAWPPTEWMNAELANEHISWKFSEDITNHTVVFRTPPPEIAKVQFSLWKSDLKEDEFPLKSAVIRQSDDWVVPVEFNFKNVSSTATDFMDIWVHL